MEKMVVRRIRRLVLALAASLAAMTAGPALAWSDLGHRVIGDLAYQRLTPATKAAVDRLIRDAAVSGDTGCPVATLADAAAFAGCVDGLRPFNDWRRAHYDAIPFCGPIDKASYCKDGRCASEAAKRAAATLADPAATPAMKLSALELLAHVIGDLHQPLDMIDNRDERGQEIRVVLPGSSDRRLNLHDFWNEVVLAPALGGEEIGVRYLEPIARAGQGWERGTIDDWASETYQIAKGLYERLPEPPTCGRNPRNPEVLDRGYVLSSVAVAREQLAKASVRLASVLNASLR